MTVDPRNAFLQFLFPALAIAVALSVARLRGYELQRDLRLDWPAWYQALLGLALWVAWLALSELVGRRLGLPYPKRWPPTQGRLLAFRVLTLVVLAPFAEELVFRGLLYYRISLTPLGPYGAILIGAVIFAVVHFQYRRQEILLIFLDGLLLGLALHASGSLVLPMVMHALGNALAVYQRWPVAEPQVAS